MRASPEAASWGLPISEGRGKVEASAEPHPGFSGSLGNQGGWGVGVHKAPGADVRESSPGPCVMQAEPWQPSTRGRRAPHSQELCAWGRDQEPRGVCQPL